MDEDWDVLLGFLPSDWRELARETGALKGLRKDKSVESLLRTLLLHLGCGHSLREAAVRARKAHLAELSAVALLKRLRKSKAWLRALCVALFREQGIALTDIGGFQVRAFDATTVKEPRSDRIVVAAALQRAPSLPDVRLLQAYGDRGAWRRRVAGAVPDPRRRLCPCRPRLRDCGGASPCGVLGRPRHGAGEHRRAAASNDRRRAVRLARGGRISEARRHGGVLARGGGWGRHRGAGARVRDQKNAGGDQARATQAAQGGRAKGQAGPTADPGVRAFRDRVHHLPRSDLHRHPGPGVVSHPLASSNRSSGASSRWRRWGICRNTTTKAPRRGSTASSWWRCWSRSCVSMPRRFPPGDTTWKRRRTHSAWRDFRFMLNQLVRAIEPPLPLAQVIEQWNDISKSLAEPPRRRRPQLSRHFA